MVTALTRHLEDALTQVRQAVVVAREDVRGNKRLVAHVVPKQQTVLTANDLRVFLREQLPEYMVPSAFVLADALRLLSNGKVDRHALLAPGQSGRDRAGFVAPRTPTEFLLTKIWQKLLGVDQVGVQENFFDLGGDSLLAFRLFAQIEKVFEKKLPLSTLFKWSTVEQLAGIISAPTSSNRPSSLVAIQLQGSKRPFFCVHPFHGDVLCYANLAHRLGQDQPFYALQAGGLDGAEEPPANIKTIAASYIEEIQTVQPHGPYALGGFCLGGVVAFEMAQQLCVKGEAVAIVALVDSPPPNLKRGTVSGSWNFLRILFRDFPCWLIGSAQLTRSEWLQLVEFEMRLVKARFASIFHSLGVSYHQAYAPKVIKEIGDMFQFSTQQREVGLAQYRAQTDYRPQVYPGRLNLFRARIPLLSSHDHDSDWEKLAGGGLDSRVVSGSHLVMLQEPHVRALAEELKDCLDQAAQEIRQ